VARSTPIREPEFDPELADLRHVLDIGLLAQENTRESRTRTGWYASNLGYCLRRQFLERAGVPTRKESQPKRQLWVGRSLEASLISRLRLAGLLISDQLHLVDEERSCSGYLDFVWGGEPYDYLEYEEGEVSAQWSNFIQTYRDEIRALYKAQMPLPNTAVELKTAAQYSAEKMASEGPMFHHKMQGAFYRIVAEAYPEQLPEGVSIDRFQLVILAKSDAKMLVFPILDVHVEQANERLDELTSYWPDTVPPCTCGRTIKWERDYCPYKAGESCCNENLLLDAPPEYWALLDAEDAEEDVPTDGEHDAMVKEDGSG
jgi:hypothetical protein